MQQKSWNIIVAIYPLYMQQIYPIGVGEEDRKIYKHKMLKS